MQLPIIAELKEHKYMKENSITRFKSAAFGCGQ